MAVSLLGGLRVSGSGGLKVWKFRGRSSFSMSVKDLKTQDSRPKTPQSPANHVEYRLDKLSPGENKVFNSRAIGARPGTVLSQDRFRKVELAVSFKRIQCYRCDLIAIYKYRVKEIRRNPGLEVPQGEELRADHKDIWETIPRFAEIPETVKCKRCGEVLGIDTLCIY